MGRYVLFFLIFLAGFVDSIAGGGGLISLTAYYAYGLSPVNALANNKFSSTLGTSFATLNYIRHGAIEWKSAIAGAIFVMIGASIGANLALLFSDIYFKYAMMVVIPVVTVMTILRKGDREHEVQQKSRMYVIISLFSLVIGIYDGFFGPGTGMFLTITFSFVGFKLIESVGNCKFVNLVSNVVSLLIFIMHGQVDYRLGIPCAIASVIGGTLGSQMALKMDRKIIRPMLILVLALLYIKVASDIF